MWMCRQESNSHRYIGPINCEFMFAGAVLDSIFIIWLANAVKCSTGKHKSTVNRSNVSVWIAFLCAHSHEHVLFHVAWLLFVFLYLAAVSTVWLHETQLHYSIRASHLLSMTPKTCMYRNASCISWNSYILISLPLPDHNFLVGHGFPIRIQFNRESLIEKSGLAMWEDQCTSNTLMK